MKYYYFSIDALPQVVQETYDHLRQEIDDWMTPENAEIWDDFKVLLDYDDKLTNLQPITKIKFLCLLTRQVIKTCSNEQRVLLDNIYNFYFSWLAVRLIESLCTYLGVRLLRANQERLRTQWELASKSLLPVQTSNYRTDEILRFLFTTLIPLAAAIQPESDKYQQVAKQDPSPVTINHPRAFAEAGGFALLLLNYSLAELEKLLVELGLLNPTTGRATPAATPGAWVGVIHALLEAKRPRLKGSKAAIWRAFSGAFGAIMSERALQNGLGTRGSTAEQFRDRALVLLNE